MALVMKSLLLFTILASGCHGLSIIPANLANQCLPQLVTQVPIQGLISNVSDLNMCNASTGQLNSLFSEFLIQQIDRRFRPSMNCKLSEVQEVACNNHGRRNHRVSFRFTGKLTCGDRCRKHTDNQNSRENVVSRRHDLRSLIRTKPTANINYLGRQVVLHYFRGSKSNFPFVCPASLITGSLTRRLPLCECPEACQSEEDVCTLPPEVGPCRALIPRFFFNSTSKQCESFNYGGCRGNGNNFPSLQECNTMCSASQCPEGKVFKTCGSSCPETCSNKDEIIACTLQCVEGCFCPPGTVELGDKCVSADECPTESPNEQCPEGKVFQGCGTACPRTCDNMNPTCTRQCVPGCFCPPGTVELGDKCVSVDECPTELPNEQCPEGKVFQGCGTACPRTCDNKDELSICTFQCVRGCFCPPGTVELGDKCVSVDECPTESPDEQCPEGKFFQECGTACPGTCDNLLNPPIICPTVCIRGCFCLPGTVQSGDTCVDPQDCDN